MISIVNISLGNPSKDRQRFVDAIVFIPAPKWSNELSKFENIIETQFKLVFERQMMLGFAKLTCEEGLSRSSTSNHLFLFVLRALTMKVANRYLHNTFNVAFSLRTSFIIDASQMYIPASSGLRFVNVSVFPLFVKELSPCFFQVMLGLGQPAALQYNVTFSFSFLVSFCGGVWIAGEPGWEKSIW